MSFLKPEIIMVITTITSIYLINSTDIFLNWQATIGSEFCLKMLEQQ